MPDPMYWSVCGSDSGCPAGRYLHNEILCVKCAPGRYSDVQDAKSCEICGKGRYAGSEGSTSCTLCSAGRFGDKEGETTNASCVPSLLTVIDSGDCQATGTLDGRDFRHVSYDKVYHEADNDKVFRVACQTAANILFGYSGKVTLDNPGGAPDTIPRRCQYMDHLGELRFRSHGKAGVGQETSKLLVGEHATSERKGLCGSYFACPAGRYGGYPHEENDKPFDPLCRACPSGKFSDTLWSSRSVTSCEDCPMGW